MNWLKNFFGIFPTFGGVPRSSRWGSARKEHLRLNPICAVCNGKNDLDVHHIQVYNLHPELELTPSNLLTLCTPHHILFGHLMNYQSYNSNVVEDAKYFHAKILSRP